MIPSCAATAAAVLAVGTLVQSPIPKMLGNLSIGQISCFGLNVDISAHLLCCRVSLLTSRKPAASARLALEDRGSGVLIGGVTCRRS